VAEKKNAPERTAKPTKVSASRAKEGTTKAGESKNTGATKVFRKESGNYPIDTKKRAANALSRVSQHGTPAEKKQVRAAVKRQYPSIEQSKGAAAKKSK